MNKGSSSEWSVILAGVFAILAVIALVVVFSGYKPPEPTSAQVGDCAMRAIYVTGYNRMPTNASDAARMITVEYRNARISPCLVNQNIDPVYDSCFLGANNSIVLQVNEKQCNLVDLKKSASANQTK